MIILPFFALQMNMRSMSLAMGEPAMMITLQYGRAQVMVAWLSQPGGNSPLEGVLEKRYWSITEQQKFRLRFWISPHFIGAFEELDLAIQLENQVFDWTK